MKKTCFSETQILTVLKEAEAGVPVADLCRQYGFGKSTFYKWKTKGGRMNTSALRRLKELEAENQRLKRLYAELSLDYRTPAMVHFGPQGSDDPPYFVRFLVLALAATLFSIHSATYFH